MSRPSGWSGAYGLASDEVRLRVTAPVAHAANAKADALDQAESDAAKLACRRARRARSSEGGRADSQSSHAAVF